MESKETLQTSISEGRSVILKKRNKTQKIKIRFNNHDVDGTRKWRVIVDGIEFLTSEINILTHSWTESEFFDDLKEYKHHIVVEAQRVEFFNNEAVIY
jgi:hypothetical protein